MIENEEEESMVSNRSREKLLVDNSNTLFKDNIKNIEMSNLNIAEEQKSFIKEDKSRKNNSKNDISQNTSSIQNYNETSTLINKININSDKIIDKNEKQSFNKKDDKSDTYSKSIISSQKKGFNVKKKRQQKSWDEGYD